MPRDRGRGIRIAVFGAMTPLGQEIVRQIESGAFPVEKVDLYEGVEREGSLTDFDGEARVATGPDTDLLGETDVAFVCGDDDPRSPEYLDLIAAGGGVAVDMVGASRMRPDVPMINFDVNPEALEPGARLVAVPHTIAQPLTTILHRLHQAFSLKDACVTAFRPASDLGKEAIDELHQQTVGLLSFAQVPKEKFGLQVAFNLAPLSVLDDAGEEVEAVVRRDVQKVMGETGSRVSLRILQAPIFFGHVYSVRVLLDAEPSIPEMEEALEVPGAIHLSGDDEGRTPAELATEPGIWIGEIAPDGGRAGAYWLWIVVDALRSGSALNAARMAGRLLEILA